MSALAGRRVVVSAGPTYEDIDPVRFIGNRSSGKMGFAIADAAARRGAHVLLIAGPVHLGTPDGVQRRDIRSAAQLFDAVMAALPCDVYIGAAAVADFTPVHMIATTPMVLVTSPRSGIRTLADVVAKAQSGRLVGYGSPG